MAQAQKQTKITERIKIKNGRMAAKVKNAKLSDLHQDDRNFNKGTEAGRELIRKSLRELGAGRSLLIDKNNKIIAGNKTHEGAEAVGLDDVIIVETDGSKVVAVKRTDIDIDTKKGREMALADNATVQVDLEWDTEAMQAAAEDFGIDLDEWGQGVDEAVGDSLVEQLEAQEYVEKENYFVKKPFVVIFYEESEKGELEKMLGTEIDNDTFTYEQLRERNIDFVSE